MAGHGTCGVGVTIPAVTNERNAGADRFRLPTTEDAVCVCVVTASTVNPTNTEKTKQTTFVRSTDIEFLVCLS